MLDTAVYEARLKARLETLEKRLQGIEKTLDQPHSRDWEDAAIETEQDEALEDLGKAGLVEIDAIQAALERITAGEFGACVTCGADISDARLHTLPHTPFCRNCAP